ncbi:thiamine diphosphokinase [Oceanicola sp. 502str15]|uniref:thiamine diphosphokinase n=1 Tax=Oceanicola sp. 502str15 TaxID=2696061 RepID=UPI002094CF12|nr:thiamine diphosphokinase [Oceanicola sp. 502str15]MCO6382961.1 thiamine diphosphokinase [Oceanicola sp. 502str15]
MAALLIDSPDIITLLGGGEVNEACLDAALIHAPRVVAADGGADAALTHGLRPEAVIGDFDSLSPAARAALAPETLHHVAEQDSTDFEKVLQRVRAPMLLAVGFLGRRLDHQLAALTALVRHPHQPCLLLGADDIAFAAPPEIALDLPAGTRLSLYPLAEVTGRSEGLEWPIDGLAFAPAGRIGTSNRTTGPLRLSFDAPGMVVITPPEALDALLAGFAALSSARAR